MQSGVFIPNSILALRGLSWFERIVLAQVCYRAKNSDSGCCTDTNEQIAQAIGCDQPKSVSRAILLMENSQVLIRFQDGKTRGLEPHADLKETPKTLTVAAGSESNSASAGTTATPTFNNGLNLPLLVEDQQPVEVGSTTSRGYLYKQLKKPLQRVESTSTDSRSTYIRIEKELKRIKRKENSKNGCVSNLPGSGPEILNEPEKQNGVAVDPKTPVNPNEAPGGAAARSARRDPFLWRSDPERCNVPFSVWYPTYQKDRGKVEAMAAWVDLTDEERLICQRHTPLFVEDTGKEWRPDPANYLLKKRFNDEIITKNEANAPTDADPGNRGSLNFDYSKSTGW